MQEVVMAWTAFSPWPALAGGVLIGVAATLLWWGLGRVAGISGIVSGLWSRERGDVAWRLAFLAGLVAVGVVAAWLAPASLAGIEARGPAAMLVAGVIVGVGTRLGNGCTAGHGVCGLSRGSLRSLVATMTFMATGVLTASLVRVFFGGSL
jgi:uncharacterized membrane protein YedE/YeeE